MISPELIRLIEKHSPMPIPDDWVEQVDLNDHLGIFGEMAYELLQEYHAQFGVSLDGFDFDNHFPRDDMGLSGALPWLMPRLYRPLTIGDLQAGIERGYLGEKPVAPVERTPAEEQRVEDAVFRLKNRLLFKPYFIVTAAMAAAGAALVWGMVKYNLEIDRKWLVAGILLPLALLWIFVLPRLALLTKPRWMEDDKYGRLHGGVVVVMMIVVPIVLPSIQLFKYLDGGKVKLLIWAVVLFVAGIFSFLAFIHTYPFNSHNLKEFAREKGIDISMLWFDRGL